MDALIAQYGSDGGASSGGESPLLPAKKPLPKVSAAPAVDTSGLTMRNNQVVAAADVRQLPDASARRVMVNLPYEDLFAPTVGPAHPYQKDGLAAGLKNHRTGHVEDTHMNSYLFDMQYNTFHARGYGHAPGSSAMVGDAKAIKQHGGEDVYGGGGGAGGGPGAAAAAPSSKRRKKEKDDEAGGKEQEPFDPTLPFTLQVKQPWAAKEAKVSELTEEQREYMAKLEADKEEKAAASVETKGPTSFFHGKEQKDYQGRSWIESPKDKRKESDHCFLPKRWVHTWSGHTKGVNAIRFFPQTGHLLLSAGLDGKVKIWDVGNNQKCMRSYLGHSKGVRDITFSHDGRRFLSTGYDKNVRLWDTETGAVLQSFNTGKMYYCVRFHPDPAKQNVIMAGCNDKKIYQWDSDTGDLVQEYNYHLGAVNTISFIDEGRRFVTTSDDKTIRVWEFGIPVQIKYIADPSMHSIPAAAMNPANTYFIGQSLDNQIVTYSAKDGRFKPEKKKTFKGHNTAGYACEVAFSPDAKFVTSGDAEGRCFFWEWAHPQKVMRTIKAHDGVCIGAEWHPLETSKVATCGWDGLIKYWD